MYLLDSSVWIDGINSNQRIIDFLKRLPPNNLGINSLIYTEVLQGADSQKKFDFYKMYLSGQPFYDFKDEKISYEKAAHIYFNCRKNGITIRSSVDCLIAQCAIENKLILLHNDKDLGKISAIYPSLKQQQI